MVYVGMKVASSPLHSSEVSLNVFEIPVCQAVGLGLRDSWGVRLHGRGIGFM